MSRDKKMANGAIFAHLERYCALRGDPIAGSGLPRWVATEPSEREFLERAVYDKSALWFGQRQSLASFSFESTTWVTIVGFESEPDLAELSFQPLHAGITTVVLSELLPLPHANTAAVRNVVEVGSGVEAGYEGHQSVVIESVFPRILVARTVDLLDDDARARLYLRICAGECAQGGSWIENDLAEALDTLTTLALPEMPYLDLCRAMIDPDPRSLFMALYRCIEATYAYESALQVIRSLGLSLHWSDLAAALEDEVGWHPQEAQNLNIVLRYSQDRDLEGVCRCLGRESGKDVRVSAGRAIYQLRNDIVHFRPSRRPKRDSEPQNWNELCRLLVNVVFDVFTTAYAR